MTAFLVWPLAFAELGLHILHHTIRTITPKEPRMGVAAAHPWLTALAVVVCLLPVAVYRLARASRQVEAAIRDVKRPALTSVPKETRTA
ncbi:MAG: hypothetical protein HOV92_12825 [Streptomyces sp.]|nr:hypothetical protein [Streptomyces sp.]